MRISVIGTNPEKMAAIEMEIKSVAVLGAGAVGSYIIWGLYENKNVRLGVVADGERAERLKADGCTINGEVYRPNIWSPEEAHGVDLLIVSLKYGALPGAMKMIRTIVGENTIVMSLMNGIDSEELIAKEIGESAVKALFADTGIRIRSTDCIREEMWSKFRLNVCNNLPQAILGAGVGCYRDSAHMKAISDGLRAELEAIAKAKGVDMSKIDSSSNHGAPVRPSARYSTLQDIEAGRHTEIDMFSGALMRMGKELGIATPYNEYTYHMIKALEEKNDGKFNYDDQNEGLVWSK